MFGIHPLYFVILLVIVLIIFGPGRLPELGGAVGKAMREFRKATNELTSEVTTAVQAKPEPPPPPPPPPPAPMAASDSTATGSSAEANPPKP
ncbi:MAG: twin-arginine translocase TatA/TatE family subunit [Candidatus Dormibacteraceae bacterium]